MATCRPEWTYQSKTILYKISRFFWLFTKSIVQYCLAFKILTVLRWNSYLICLLKKVWFYSYTEASNYSSIGLNSHLYQGLLFWDTVAFSLDFLPVQLGKGQAFFLSQKTATHSAYSVTSEILLQNFSCSISISMSWNAKGLYSPSLQLSHCMLHRKVCSIVNLIMVLTNFSWQRDYLLSPMWCCPF